MKVGDIKPGDFFLYAEVIWLKTTNSNDYVKITEAVAVRTPSQVETKKRAFLPLGAFGKILNSEEVEPIDADFFLDDDCIARTYPKET